MSEADKSIAGLMESMGSRVVCRWCKHPKEEVMRKIGLCAHCNRLRREMIRLENIAEQSERERGGITHDLYFRLKVQRKKIEAAQDEGEKYGYLFADFISGLDLEHELRLVSGRFVNKDFFYSDASWLNLVFSPLQRKHLYYMLSLMNREYMRQNRHKFAMSKIYDEYSEPS